MLSVKLWVWRWTVKIVKTSVTVNKVLLGILDGVCLPVLQILTQFQTKKYNFPHPFADQTSKIHTDFQTWPLGRNYVKKFFKSISSPHISLFFLLIWNWNAMVRFQTKTAQKPTRWGGTYLYFSLYKGVPPRVSTTLTWTAMFWIWYFPSGC